MTLTHTERHIRWSKLLLILLPFLAGDLNAAVTKIVGNKTYSGSMGSNSGPEGDGNATAYFNTGANIIVIPRASQLQPSNIKLKLGQTDTAANPNTGLIYCTNGGSGEPITLESHLVASPYSYGGHKLFKTNIEGLYFTMHMYNLVSFDTTSTSDFYVGEGNMGREALVLNYSAGCTGNSGKYQALGGLEANVDLEFYNDATFNPDTTGSITLLSDSPYHYTLKNLNPGAGLVSRYIYQIINLDNVTLSSPTCLAAVLSGDSVTQSDTVRLGDYTPKEVIEGVSSVPFAIDLQNCYRVTDIEVKMTTSAPATSPSLLGNTLTRNEAQGVGVEIKGLQNSHYPEVLLLPNDASSVYKAYSDNADPTNGIIGTGSIGTAVSQPLNFTATLKQDSNQRIVSGEFKATAVFSITYP
ncbi:fimbrial protein [Pseudocitrobacter faecalis]|uniref:Type 1 fimbria pilin n=1 Tax=Pseudocitrobacter faecalis TaxID=1398493 RepID=A0ABX9FQT2_9ENTR|nr:type 1 fimbria pilin [Pseudocitrobacter faecalis]